MQIGEASDAAAAGAGPAQRNNSPEPPPGFFRLWLVDSRYVLVEPTESVEYKVLDEGGRVLASGSWSGQAYIDVEAPESGQISLWLDGEVLTVHDQA
ncbi:MAG: hypothetical protein AAF721_05685 [Myxococcota bacterium]